MTQDGNGTPMRLAVVRTAAGVWIGWPGRAKFFTAERTGSDKGKTHHDELRAPMTAKVVKVQTRVGDRVKAGQVLVILEAMKMEYQLQSPYDAVVDGVFCKEGELVDLGKTVAKLTEVVESAPAAPA